MENDRWVLLEDEGLLTRIHSNGIQQVFGWVHDDDAYDADGNPWQWWDVTTPDKDGAGKSVDDRRLHNLLNQKRRALLSDSPTDEMFSAGSA
jgi:hypothetical protein